MFCVADKPFDKFTDKNIHEHTWNSYLCLFVYGGDGKSKYLSLNSFIQC